MNNRRLWPVVTALSTLIAGSVTIELLAQLRDPSLERIEITSNEVATEEDQVEPVAEQFGAPLGVEHIRARELARRGELADAADRLAEIAAMHPQQALVRAEQAHVLLRLSRPKDALVLLEAAALELPASPAVLLDLGLCQDALGHTGQARETLGRALRLRPNHSAIRIALGEILRREGDLIGATRVLEPAATQGSNDERSRALASLGRCQMAQGHTAQARAAFEESVQRAPAAVNTWVRVTRGLLQSEDRSDQERALQHADRAVRLAPDLPLVHSLRGRVYEKLDRQKDATAAYRHAVRLDSNYAYARRRLLRLGLDAEDFRLAREQAEALLRSGPEVPEHHFLAGLVAARAGELDAARRHYQQAIDRSGKPYPEALYNLGLLERQAKNPLQAVAAYERAIAARPGFRAAHNNLGLVYLDQDDVVRAEAAFRKAIEIDIKYAGAWTNLGRCLALQQQHEAALAAYQHAMSLSPASRSLTVDYAVALRKAGKSAEAIALYRNLLDTDPRYVTGWYNLGVALESAGQSAEAKRAYERSLELDPEHVKALKNLAQLEGKAGQLGPARALLNDALDHDPSDQEARLELAQLMLTDHDLEGCSRAARLVLAQTPNHKGAEALLNRCKRQP